MKKKILFLINPVSGSSPGPVLEARIKSALHHGGVGTEHYDTAFTGVNIAAQVKKLAPHYEVLVGVGGDGTFGGIMQAVARMKKVPKLAILPYGVGNDMARSLGMFSVLKQGGINRALAVILKGKTNPIDVMEVNGQSLCAGYFGAGSDALTSNIFNELRPKAMQPAARVRIIVNNTLYGLLAMKNLAYSIPFPYQLKFSDSSGNYKVINVPAGSRGILVTNTPVYAGGSLISSKADMGDGKFEVTIISHLREWWSMHLTRFFRRPLDVLSPHIIQVQTDHLQVHLGGRTFYQLDGERPAQAITGGRILDFKISGRVQAIMP
jgi:diacylglycerol kinase family enzyme